MKKIIIVIAFAAFLQLLNIDYVLGTVLGNIPLLGEALTAFDMAFIFANRNNPNMLLDIVGKIASIFISIGAVQYLSSMGIQKPSSTKQFGYISYKVLLIITCIILYGILVHNPMQVGKEILNELESINESVNMINM
jgi:hypothetical protein